MVIAVLALSACSDDEPKEAGDEPRQAATATSTAASTATGTAGPQGSGDGRLEAGQRVAVVRGETVEFRRRETVRNGDRVVLQTQVLPKSAPASTLAVSVERGPAATLKISAGAEGEEPTGVATLRSRDGSKISLSGLAYKCGAVGVATGDSFCPLEARNEKQTIILTRESPPTDFPFNLAADVVVSAD